LRRVVKWLQHVRRRLLPWTAEPGRGAFAIPFVDYARGDGVAIGAGHEFTWITRRSWTDPLGWVGLAGVPATPVEEEQHLRSRIAEIDDDLAGLEEQVVAER